MRRIALIISIVLHAALICPVPRFSKNTQTIEVSVSAKERRSAKASATGPQKANGNMTENAEKPIRIGMIESDGALSLGQKISASNYFDRLRAVVEPAWSRAVHTHVGKTRPKCICEYVLDIDSHGRMSIVTLAIQKCDRASLCSVTKDVLTSTGYPPPPKDLLTSGHVEVYWIFQIGI